jgi:hypothetical protein
MGEWSPAFLPKTQMIKKSKQIQILAGVQEENDAATPDTLRAFGHSFSLRVK